MEWGESPHSFNQRPIKQEVALRKFWFKDDSGTLNPGIIIAHEYIQCIYTYTCFTTRQKTEVQVMYLFRFCQYEIGIVKANSHCSVEVVNDSIIKCDNVIKTW